MCGICLVFFFSFVSINSVKPNFKPTLYIFFLHLTLFWKNVVCLWVPMTHLDLASPWTDKTVKICIYMIGNKLQHEEVKYTFPSSARTGLTAELTTIFYCSTFLPSWILSILIVSPLSIVVSFSSGDCDKGPRERWLWLQRFWRLLRERRLCEHGQTRGPCRQIRASIFWQNPAGKQKCLTTTLHWEKLW